MEILSFKVMHSASKQIKLWQSRKKFQQNGENLRLISLYIISWNIGLAF